MFRKRNSCKSTVFGWTYDLIDGDGSFSFIDHRKQLSKVTWCPVRPGLWEDPCPVSQLVVLITSAHQSQPNSVETLGSEEYLVRRNEAVYLFLTLVRL